VPPPLRPRPLPAKADEAEATMVQQETIRYLQESFTSFLRRLA
jgi:hypothetical protein